MKILNLIILSITLTISTNTFASGCNSLANTNWRGTARIMTFSPHKRPVVTATPFEVHISSIQAQGNGFYQLQGTLNGEKLIDPVGGCIENKEGNLRSVSFRSQSGSLTSITFSPDAKNPTSLQRLFGRWNNGGVETTTSPAENYLNKY